MGEGWRWRVGDGVEVEKVEGGRGCGGGEGGGWAMVWR